MTRHDPRGRGATSNPPTRFDRLHVAVELVAPIIPGLTDHEVPAIVARPPDAGARFASYTVVRLPLAVKDVFAAWVGTHYPDRANKVLNQVRDMRGGALNDARFGHRMHGHGPEQDEGVSRGRRAPMERVTSEHTPCTRTSRRTCSSSC